MSQKWKHLSYFQFYLSCCFEKYWFQSFYPNCSIGSKYQERLEFHLYYSFILRVNHVFSASYFYEAGMLLTYQWCRCLKVQCINLPPPKILQDAVIPNTLILIVSLLTGSYFYVFLAQTSELFDTDIKVPPFITMNAFQVECTPCYNSSFSSSNVKHSVG